MTITIAVAGKGGTGKTTIAALLIQMLREKGVVLAIDGDPSANLNMALGLPLENTVGDVREEMLASVKKGSFAAGVSKQDYLEVKIQESLVESEKVDLLAMGRPEGPGCYCAANNMLRACIDRMGGSYDYVVIDNEAGMEHISRQTTRDIDFLLLVSDTSMRGITAAARMKELIGEMRTHVGKMGLVVNRVSNGMAAEVKEAIAAADLELLGTIPEDGQIASLDSRGKPIVELGPDSSLRLAVRDVAAKLGLL